MDYRTQIDCLFCMLKFLKNVDGHRSDLYTISSPAANSRLLLIFSYSLNPDQARQNIGPDLDPKCFTLHVPAERFLENFILNKSTDDKKS